jgi:hypothetical protein
MSAATYIVRGNMLGSSMVGLRFEDEKGNRLEPKEVVASLLEKEGIEPDQKVLVKITNGAVPESAQKEVPAAKGVASSKVGLPDVDWDEVAADMKDTDSKGTYYAWATARFFTNLHRRVSKLEGHSVIRELRKWLHHHLEFGEEIEIVEVLKRLET